MSKEIGRDFASAPQYMPDAPQGRRDPEFVLHTSRTRGFRSNAELDSTDAPKENPILLGSVTVAYEGAIQALRDVRHLLPPDGVAIVDAVVDCAPRDRENIDFLRTSGPSAETPRNGSVNDRG